MIIVVKFISKNTKVKNMRRAFRMIADIKIDVLNERSKN